MFNISNVNGSVNTCNIFGPNGPNCIHGNNHDGVLVGNIGDQIVVNIHGVNGDLTICNDKVYVATRNTTQGGANN